MMKRVAIALTLLAVTLCIGVARAEEEFNRAKIEYVADKLQVAAGTERQKSIEDMVRVGKVCLPIVNAMLLEDNPQLAGQVDALIKQLGDNDPRKRGEAQQGLIGIGLKALPQVAAATKNPDGEIAYRCINIKRAIEATAVQAVAMRTRQFTALIAVVKVLHDPSSLKALEKCSQDTERDIRIAAVEALAAFADPSSLDALAKRLEDDDVHVRLLAGAGIIGINNEAARAKTVSMLLDPKGNVYLRRQAALCLANTGEKKYIGDLIKVLNDPSFVVRYAAFKGVQTLGGTTETFGYDYLGDDEAAAAARAKAIEQWTAWAKKNP
jgi:HEAT repeat protein